MRRPLSMVILAMLVSTAIRAWLAHRYFGFQTGDDLEIVEEALRRAIGLIHSPWNVRNLLIPDLMVAPFIKVAWWIGVRDSLALADVARLPFVILAAVNIILLYHLGRRWYDEWTGVIAAVLYSFHWIPLVYGSSSFPRTVAVTCILIAALILDDFPFLAGLVAALAMTARYSEATFFISLLIIARHRPRLIAGFILGFAFFVGIYDWMTWGQPFSSLMAFAELTFIRRDASSAVVHQPLWWYLTNSHHWIAPTALPLLFVTTPRRRLTAFLAIPLIALSLIFHKELRYLQVIIPFALLFAAHGFIIFPHRRVATVLLMLTLPLGLTRIGTVTRRSTNAAQAARWLASRTPHPHTLGLSQAWAYGGRVFLGNDPIVIDLGTPPTPATLVPLTPTLDCAALYASDLTPALSATLSRARLTERTYFAGPGGRGVEVFCGRVLGRAHVQFP